jgi:predicted RNase H-like HicB family nuclease
VPARGLWAAAWEKLSIFLTFLTPKLPAPVEEDLSKGILESIDMDSYRVEKRKAISAELPDEDAEIGGGRVRLRLRSARERRWPLSSVAAPGLRSTLCGSRWLARGDERLPARPAWGAAQGGDIMRSYSFVVERDPETDHLVGYVPGWPGAHSQGADIDELQVNLQEVIEMLLEDGEPKLESEFIDVRTIQVA